MREWTQPVSKHRSELVREPVNLRQVIAFNLGEARRGREWTQQRLGSALSELTGKSWNVPAVSAAESGWTSVDRLRSFDVTDLLALSITLHVPVAYFLLPPSIDPAGQPVDPDDLWIEIGKPGGDTAELMSSTFLAWVVLNMSQVFRGRDLMRERLLQLPIEGLTWMGCDDPDAADKSELLEELADLLRRHR